MLRKMGLIAVLMAILSLPLAAFAQDLSRSEDVNTANVAHNSFVILSEEETGVPGYITRDMRLLVRIVRRGSR